MSSVKKVSIYTVSGVATFRGRNPLPHPTSLDLSSCSPLRKKWLSGHNPQKSTHAALCTIGHHAFAACGYDLHEILDSGSSDDGPEPPKEGTLVLEIDCSSTDSGISADSDDLYGDGAGGKRETPGTEEEVLSPGSSSCPIAYSCMYNKSYEEPLDIILEENAYDYRLTRNIVSEDLGRHPSGGVISATVPAAGSRGGNKGCVGEGNDACDGTVVVDSPKKNPQCDDPDVIGEQGAVGGPSLSPISPVSLQSPSSTLPVTESSTVSAEDLQSPSSVAAAPSSPQVPRALAPSQCHPIGPGCTATSRSRQMLSLTWGLNLIPPAVMGVWRHCTPCRWMGRWIRPLPLGQKPHIWPLCLEPRWIIHSLTAPCQSTLAHCPTEIMEYGHNAHGWNSCRILVSYVLGNVYMQTYFE